MIFLTSLFEPMPVVVSALCSFRGLVQLRSTCNTEFLVDEGLDWAPSSVVSPF